MPCHASLKAEGNTERGACSPLFRFCLDVPCFFVFSGKKISFIEAKARVLPLRRNDERDSRLPPPEALGGPCRLTMRQSCARPKKCDTIYRQNPKLREILRGAYDASSQGDLPGGGLCAGFTKNTHIRSRDLKCAKLFKMTLNKLKSKRLRELSSCINFIAQ